MFTLSFRLGRFSLLFRFESLLTIAPDHDNAQETPHYGTAEE